MKVHVVYSHPVGDSFCAALRDATVSALTAAGHDVDLLDLYAERFDPLFSREARRNHRNALATKPDIVPFANRLLAAEAIVFVYPTWWSGQPAMLKGWMDRILVQGVAYELPDGTNSIKPGLRHVRKLVVITTHGSRKSVNVLQGESGKRVLLRGFRSLCHPRARSRWLAMYGMDTATQEQRKAFLAKVTKIVGRL